MLNVLREIYETTMAGVEEGRQLCICHRANTYTTPHAVPSDLRYYIGDGSIQPLMEQNVPDHVCGCPFEEQVMRKQFPLSSVDYGSKTSFCIVGYSQSHLYCVSMGFRPNWKPGGKNLLPPPTPPARSSNSSVGDPYGDY